MSMKLNLGLLATKLSQADPEETIPPVDCNAYLVDKIFLPLSVRAQGATYLCLKR